MYKEDEETPHPGVCPSRPGLQSSQPRGEGRAPLAEGTAHTKVGGLEK